jgi:hypothetical protein
MPLPASDKHCAARLPKRKRGAEALLIRIDSGGPSLSVPINSPLSASRVSLHSRITQQEPNRRLASLE